MNILLTDSFHPALAGGLAKRGHRCTVREDIDTDGVRAVIGDYEGLVVATKIRVDRALLGRAGRLRFVARAGSGMENVDVDAAREFGVACLHSPEGNRDAVAEHATGMLLALLHRIAAADAEMRRGVWRREVNRGVELLGRTVGILGYGHTGRAFAARLRGFGVRVLAYDKYVPAPEGGDAEPADPDEIAGRADVLSLHLPLTPETRGLVDAGYIGRFARPFWLLNTSRGAIVRTVDLVDALREGRVRGAALDVFENEDPSTFGPGERVWWDALRADERVVISPHVAGWTVESRQRIAEVLLARIDALDA